MVGTMVHEGVVPNAVDVPMVLAGELDFVANFSRLWPWALMAYCWALESLWLPRYGLRFHKKKRG